MNKIKKAFFVSLPIAFGYISLGFMGGAIIQKSGFNLVEILLMSTLVFSGSAVFISANMLSAGIYPQISLYLTATIIITNLRNIMYSSSLVNDTRDIKGWKKVLFAQYVTDETFAINKIMYEKDKDWDGELALYVNIFGCIYGLIGNGLGGFFGQVVDIPLDLGFFMMSSMFVVLITLQMRNKLDFIMLLVSIIVSFLLLSVYQGGLDLIVIAMTVTTIGYFLDKKMNKDEVIEDE
ncbi:AzlC family ABC transporter permease [Peptostreptococcus canis]|uniref:AzlC family ABC transporter permease n=1 Tax=Peptostreptococcus canis TaxID=1159213 RepID=A0ABR6TLM6_9FIRM|nr:AzlC family ABC transporter permease [Peptostreptococcus canis]MBC2576322.1 AzlC family ABC transporter permease [Peptostreptococcus canis]MBP1998520.1 4-azaleucine resistance transporter AzlC [Peptostreptococcus canis]